MTETPTEYAERILRGIDAMTAGDIRALVAKSATPPGEYSLEATGCRFYHPGDSDYGQAVGTSLRARFDRLTACPHATRIV